MEGAQPRVPPLKIKNRIVNKKTIISEKVISDWY